MQNGTFAELGTQPKVSFNGDEVLAKEIEGYVYQKTQVVSKYGRTFEVLPVLRKQNGNSWYVKDKSNSWTTYSLTNYQVQVIYRKINSTAGGTSSDSTATPDWSGLNITGEKTSTDNGNGTNTITLSVTGDEKTLENGKVSADIIVVFDVSGSMNDGRSTRLSEAKTAVNQMASSLLGEGSKVDARINIIPFSTKAITASGWMTDTQRVRSYVNGLTATGGTNWEDALIAADETEADPNRNTYVIFVTDGNPTFRDSWYGGAWFTTESDNYSTTGCFGTGNSDPYGYNYNAALVRAINLVSHNKTLYGISIQDANRLSGFISSAGGAACYEAKKAGDLAEAFQKIVNNIKETLGAADVTISDGITEGISLDAKVGEKLTGGFTYTIKNSTGTYTGVEQNNRVEFSSLNLTFPKAQFLNGSVVWSLGSDYQLKDGWTYQVSFTVWPDQNVYDTVAKLNAGTITEIPDRYSGILINDNGTYKIKTNVENADVTKYSWHWSEASGSKVSLQDGTQSEGYNLVDPMPLVSRTVQVQKTWQNSKGESYTDDRITALGITSVDITVTGDGVPFSKATLTADNSWFAGSLYIAPGLIIQKNGSYMVFDKGHSYTAAETMNGGTPDEWEMTSTSVRPMRLGSSTGVQNVLLVEDPQGSITVDGITYSISENNIASVTVNNRKTTPDEATITIKKELAGEGAEADREFSFIMQLTLPEGTTWDGGDGFTKNHDGTWSFNLKGGESITATLPIGAGYQISEESLTA